MNKQERRTVGNSLYGSELYNTAFDPSRVKLGSKVKAYIEGIEHEVILVGRSDASQYKWKVRIGNTVTEVFQSEISL